MTGFSSQEYWANENNNLLAQARDSGLLDDLTMPLTDSISEWKFIKSEAIRKTSAVLSLHTRSYNPGGPGNCGGFSLPCKHTFETRAKYFQNFRNMAIDKIRELETNQAANNAARAESMELEQMKLEYDRNELREMRDLLNQIKDL